MNSKIHLKHHNQMQKIYLYGIDTQHFNNFRICFTEGTWTPVGDILESTIPPHVLETGVRNQAFSHTREIPGDLSELPPAWWSFLQDLFWLGHNKAGEHPSSHCILPWKQLFLTPNEISYIGLLFCPQQEPSDKIQRKSKRQKELFSKLVYSLIKTNSPKYGQT